MQPAPLTWTSASATAHLSDTGTYLVVEVALPIGGTRWQLRELHPDMGSAWPQSAGILPEECSSLDEARRYAERRNYVRVNAASATLPEDYPAQVKKLFFWPVSDGTTRAAVTLDSRPDGSVIASIVGMSRGETLPDGEAPFRPAIWASLVLHPGQASPVASRPAVSTGEPPAGGCDPTELLADASAEDRMRCALENAARYGGIDGDHHKAWVIDRMVAALTGPDYCGFVAAACAGDDGPDSYEWNTGIAP